MKIIIVFIGAGSDMEAHDGPHHRQLGARYDAFFDTGIEIAEAR